MLFIKYATLFADTRANVLFIEEWETSVQHIVKKNTQWPRCCFLRKVKRVKKPFRWTVQTSSWKFNSFLKVKCDGRRTLEILVTSLLEQSSCAKINKSNFSCQQIDDHIFILQVTMEHSSFHTVNGCLNDLLEKVSSQLKNRWMFAIWLWIH